MKRLGWVVAVAMALLLVNGCAGAARPPTAPRLAPGSSPNRSGSASPGTARSPAQPSARVVVASTNVRLPHPLARMAVIGSGTGAIVAGGMVAGDGSTASAYRLDLVRGLVKKLPDLPVAVHDAAGGLIRGRPAVLGGGNAAEQAAVQLLGRDGRWRMVGQLPSTRSDLSVVSKPGGDVWVIGGYDGRSVPRTVLATADGTRFRTVTRLSKGVRYAATASTPSGIWVLGGEANGAELDVVQRIDSASGQTRVTAKLPRPLGHAMSVSFGDRILLMGGRTAPHTLTDRMWWFDTLTCKFTSAGRLPTKLADAGVLPAGRFVYLLGGEKPDITRNVLKVALR